MKHYVVAAAGQRPCLLPGRRWNFHYPYLGNEKDGYGVFIYFEDEKHPIYQNYVSGYVDDGQIRPSDELVEKLNAIIVNGDSADDSERMNGDVQ